MVWFWIILIAVVAIIIFSLYKLKIPKCGCMTLVTGGVKTGKSAMSVRLAHKTYRMNIWKYRLKCLINFFRRRSKRRKIERPLLYSNVPLRCDYVPLTLELLNRQERFSYGSVIYVCEASLVANSMDYKDGELNDQLLLFNKLIGHETRGGSIFYDTQSISDNHYAVKRCLASYFYIHHNWKIPFIALICFVRELKFSEDNSAVNVYEGDVEEGLQMVIIPWRSLKLYDRYCYSVLTDDLPVQKNVIRRSRKQRKNRKLDLKARQIISFKDRWSKHAKV